MRARLGQVELEEIVTNAGCVEDAVSRAYCACGLRGRWYNDGDDVEDGREVSSTAGCQEGGTSWSLTANAV